MARAVLKWPLCKLWCKKRSICAVIFLFPPFPLLMYIEEEATRLSQLYIAPHRPWVIRHMSLTRVTVNGKIQQRAYGGVGAPVGLTVFKTAGGSLGAVPGGFDSHTPLPGTVVCCLCAVYCNRGINVNSILSVEKVRRFVCKHLRPT
jgi:hypothetical protein